VRAVGIRELKDHLSEYVRLASAGEVVLVTDRDRVVAELVQPGARRHRGDALWADLVGQGLLRPPLVADGSPPPYLGGATSDQLAAELDADREDR
jgi:antitoxin (DNA-binding transcriptional repressor) of toxin-antitoxin stability system